MTTWFILVISNNHFWQHDLFWLYQITTFDNVIYFGYQITTFDKLVIINNQNNFSTLGEPNDVGYKTDLATPPRGFDCQLYEHLRREN